MNFCVHQDTGSEIQGYLVPDGFSTKPRVHVRIDGSDKITEIYCWIFVEGARAQGLHDTGNVAFILNDNNVPGIGAAREVEISDPESGLVFYRRAQPGQYIQRKVLRMETSYVPSTELDLSLKPHFQFHEHRVEHYGFETIRQMLEILHQPSVYVAGRILLKNFRVYIDYNIDTTMIALRDPFYELALRLVILGRYNKHRFSFVAPRDKSLFQPVMAYFDGLVFNDEDAVRKAVRAAPKDMLSLLTSPFTQQLVAASPTDLPTLDNVAQALDALSQFTLFDSGREETTYARLIADLFGLPQSCVQIKRQLEPVHQLADILRTISRIEHLLEADLLLYHFIQKAEERTLAKA